MKILRKLYDWSLEQAKTRHAERSLFWIAFAESSFFPVPPDVLLMAMVLAHREKWKRFFLICLTGSVLGGVAGYLIGVSLWSVVGPFFLNHVFPPAAFERVRQLYLGYDFWIVFIAAFTPIPYKVFTIAAGVSLIPLPGFILASVIGRGGRFGLVAFLLERFGTPVRSFIDKYFNLLTLLFAALLAGGFFLLKYAHH